MRSISRAASIASLLVLVIPKIFKEWSTAFVDVTHHLCLCCGIGNQYERSYSGINNPQSDSSHTYSLHFGPPDICMVDPEVNPMSAEGNQWNLLVTKG
jgi:hypothetical protein